MNMPRRRALHREVEEPPGNAEIVEGNVQGEDSDQILAREYVFRVILGRGQRRSIRTVDADSQLKRVALSIVTAQIEQHQRHPEYLNLVRSDDRRCVREYVHFLRMTDDCLKRLKSREGERTREDFARSLGYGDGV
jgi:hypothetical protein